MSELTIVYDGECPFCSSYRKLVRIRELPGSVRFVDARQPDTIHKEIADLGLDLDQGMVVKFDNCFYHGSDAVNLLSRLCSRSDAFNRLNYLLFRSKHVSSAIYPLLKGGRNLALWVKDVPSIENLKKEKSHD